MIKRFNEPNHSFIVETLTPEGFHLCYWRIDQVLERPKDDAAIDRLCNQVNRHLHGLSVRLGLKFGVVAEGALETIDVIVKSFGYEIS
jgi:hypothetical protein